VGVEQEQLAILYERVGVLKIGKAATDGLDFGAAEDDAGFHLVGEKVVVGGGAVLRGIALTGGDGVAARVLLLVRSGLSCVLAGHGLTFKDNSHKLKRRKRDAV
jgi:hypothetical protein